MDRQHCGRRMEERHSVAHLKDLFDLDGDAEGQAAHPDGTTGAFAGLFAEDIDHQFAEAVDHLRVLWPMARG